MTPSRWQSCRTPQRMLDYLSGRLSARKMRLISVAWCRRFWGRLSHPDSRRAVEVAELFAEGRASRRRLTAWHNRAMGLYWGEQECPAAAQAAYNCADDDPWAGAALVAHVLGERRPRERPTQAALVRDIAGDPFQAHVVSPLVLAWEGGTVVRLAEAAYEERAFGRLPIVADAAEEAGAAEALVAHLRSPGPHARGCWALDLLLGKA